MSSPTSEEKGSQTIWGVGSVRASTLPEFPPDRKPTGTNALYPTHGLGGGLFKQISEKLY